MSQLDRERIYLAELRSMKIQAENEMLRIDAAIDQAEAALVALAQLGEF